MKNQRGAASPLLLSFIMVIVLFIGAASFGVWAFMGRQDYKKNSDQKVATASAETKKQVQDEDAAKYAEEAKNPLKTYTGPTAFGSVSLQYPKTWSAYMAEAKTVQSSQPINGFIHPNVVPDISNPENSFALRVQIVSQPYDNVLTQYNSLAVTGKVVVQPYTLPKVPTVVGTRINGQIEATKQGSMVVFPLRNLTLKVWTQSADYIPDFDTIILPNLSFSP